MFWVFLMVTLTGVLLRMHADRRRRLATRAPPDDPRWNAGPRRQIAGRSCIECGVKIVTANEGDPCDVCEEVAHRDTCLAQHARTAHRLEPHVPYR
jgi:hypothetical protein